jgi:hypothetical protein
MEISEFAAWLQKIEAERYRAYAGALASYAVVPKAPNDDAPEVLTCRWLFSDEKLEPRNARIYPQIELGEVWFDRNEANDALIKVLAGEKPLGSGSVSDASFYHPNRTAGEQSYSGWSETTVAVRIDSMPSIPWNPIAAKGLRPYSSGKNALIDWVWHGALPVSNHFPREVPHINNIFLILPDTRARIVKADWQGDVLSIETEFNIEPEQLDLQVTISYGERSFQLPPCSLQQNTNWTVPEDVVVVELFLVHADGTLLSHLQVTRGEHYQAHAGQLSLRDRAENELKHGEGDQVEYKPFIEVSDQKEWEIIETVVAFSNSAGGRLYIGVSNAGVPADEVQLRKVGKADAEKSLSTLIARVQELVREKIKPVPRVAVEQLLLSGSWIIVVDVPPSTEGPFATLQNDIYIRKGASNYKPDPLTELPGLYRRNQSPTGE